MRANFNKAVMAARSILRQTARKEGVSYEEVYEGFQDAIRYGLESTEPQTVQFWRDVKRQAKKEVPTPEDVLIYVSELSQSMPESGCVPANIVGRVLH